MARTSIPDRVTLVGGVAETAPKAVPSASTSSEIVLDLAQFPVGAIIQVRSEVSYNAGRSWAGFGGCTIKISDASQNYQDRPNDGLTRFFCGSREMRGKTGILQRVFFAASLDGKPISLGFDLVTGFDDDRVRAAQVSALGLK